MGQESNQPSTVNRQPSILPFLTFNPITDHYQGYTRAGACVDEHSLDQLVIYMALARGRSAVKGPPRAMVSSLHVETAVHMGACVRR